MWKKQGIELLWSVNRFLGKKAQRKKETDLPPLCLFFAGPPVSSVEEYYIHLETSKDISIICTRPHIKYNPFLGISKKSKEIISFF
jgi:hypothetical protein